MPARKTRDEASACFEAKKCIMIGEYKNCHDKIEFECHCGARGFTTLNQTRKDSWVGCGDCSKKNVEDNNMKKYGSKSSLGNAEVREKTRLSYLKRTGFSSPAQNPEVIEKRRKTYEKKTGYKHPSQNPEVKEKKIQTNRKKRGVDTPFQDPGSMEKAKITIKEKYGVEYPSQSAEIREKARKTNKERTGYGNSGQDPKSQKKARETYEKKTGHKHPFADPGVQEKIKNTHLKRRGVPYAMQDPKVLAKNRKSAGKIKTYIFPSGREMVCQGWEPQAVELLLSEGVSEEDIISPLETGMTVKYHHRVDRVYTPDLYVVSTNTFVEVKSTYTYDKIREGEKNLTTAKLEGCRKKGYNTRLLVFIDAKGKIALDEYEKAHQQNERRITFGR